MVAFLVFFVPLYFIVAELNSAPRSTAEVLVFPHGRIPRRFQKGVIQGTQDEGVVSNSMTREGEPDVYVASAPARNDVFGWRDIVYDIKTKGEPRRLLDGVSGWVRPGTLTALMGASGAGKTTLLNVLAQRTNVGVITGDMAINGKPLDASFCRKTGYVQQQGKTPNPFLS